MLRYGLGGSLALATAFGGYTTFAGPNSNFDIYNVGVARFGRAAYTVGSIGLDYKRTLYGSSVSDTDPDYEENKSKCHQRSADKLLQLCRDNGGCFIKVGQHIGALDYLLPSEYVQTMKVLHHKAPQMRLEDVFQVIREDLGQEPTEIFTDFQEEPLGTASLAQVHRAHLKETGEEVAVKVQHRYVRNHSFVDIQTMHFLVKSVKFFFPQFEFMWLAEEMKKNLPLELSFTQEGLNAERISYLLEKFEWLRIPEIHWAQTTDRVLTMEFCSGGHVNDVDYLRKNNIDPYAVSERISRMYADMIFRFGYVHCDPHPGNILVNKNAGGDPQIVLLDHGLYSQLTHEFRHDYAEFWLSILKSDTDGIKRYADKLGVGQLYGLFACMVAGRSWKSIQKGLDKSERSSDENDEIKANAQKFIRQIADVLAFVNRQMILIFKTNDLLRAIEFSLGTSSSMNSFIQMSRSCYRCLNHESLRRCRGGRMCRWRVQLSGAWQQFKISFYQLFLFVWFSSFGKVTRSLLLSES